MEKICRFRDDYYFLSNFYPCIVNYDGRKFRSSEAAFQSAKCLSESDKDLFMTKTPVQAKRDVRKMNTRPDWTKVSIQVMYDVVYAKFTQNPALKEKLLATGDAYLEEGNFHKDDFWGTYYGKGKNMLGKILMLIRQELYFGKRYWELKAEGINGKVNTSNRPELTKDLDSKTFKEYYYLKDELIAFCNNNNLQSVGSKEELTERIVTFLDTGERISKSYVKSYNTGSGYIDLDSLIGENFVCSERHREFYIEHIGSSFKFIVGFQKWLKENPDKTYRDSIDAYYQILEEKKNGKSTIGKQFEYNTYIRDFFEDNKGMSLDEAIKCWKYKKSLKGSNKYERSDLEILNKQ